MGWFGVVRGHPSSMKIAPFDGAHTTSYSSLIGAASLYFAEPLAFNGPDRGITQTISIKIARRSENGKVHSGEEILPKASTP